MVMNNQRNMWSIAESGHETMMRLFIDNGADLNAKTRNGWCLLHFASRRNQCSLVTLLIEKGADIEAKNNDGMTPLQIAARSRFQHEILRYLIDAGADVCAEDKRGLTALHLAAACGNTLSIDLLQAHGALIDTRSAHGWTPLCLAAGFTIEESEELPQDLFGEIHRYGTTEAVELLLKLGADASAGCTVGITVLHRAVMSGEKIIVKLLLEHGARVNARDQTGRTVLHYAASFNSEAITSLILENSAEKDVKDESGDMALHVAISKWHNELAVALLEAGADVAVKQRDGNTALHLASLAGNLDMVEALLRYGADIDAVNKTRQTALDLAAREGWKRTTEILLNHMDGVDVQDIDGDTPLDTVQLLVGSTHSSPPLSDSFENPAQKSIKVYANNLEQQRKGLSLPRQEQDQKSGSSHAQRDYQTQLMLLEQQKKKRLLISRIEQGQKSDSPIEQDQESDSQTKQDQKSGSNFVLKNYQMQLMLLQQQKKQRLLKARMGQDHPDNVDHEIVRQLLLDRGLNADMNVNH